MTFLKRKQKLKMNMLKRHLNKKKKDLFNYITATTKYFHITYNISHIRSSTQRTVFMRSIVNEGGENIDDITLSKKSTWSAGKKYVKRKLTKYKQISNLKSMLLFIGMVKSYQMMQKGLV